MSTHMAAGPVDLAAAADRAEVAAQAEVVDRAAAVGMEVPEVQWAAAQPHPGASPAVVQPAVGTAVVRPAAGTAVVRPAVGTAAPDTAQVTRPPQPPLMELPWLITLPWLSQKIRRLVTRLSGTVLLPTQCYNGPRTGFGAGRQFLTEVLLRRRIAKRS